MIEIVIGIILGIAVKRNWLAPLIPLVVFYFLLPYVNAVEISAMEIKEWPFILYGIGFTVVLFYFGRLWAGKDNAVLLATAEGGTLGLVLYLAIGSEPLYKFLLVNNIGVGLALFSFINYQLGSRSSLKSLFNPLMIGAVAGIILSLAGINLKTFPAINFLEPYVISVLVILISAVIGMQLEWRISRDTFQQKFFWQFWLIRIICATLSVFARAPLAVSVLFVLPPSFLLPMMYSENQPEKAVKAGNFIAATVPVSLVLSAVIYWILKP